MSRPSSAEARMVGGVTGLGAKWTKVRPFEPLLEGTAAETGQPFFEALVRNLAGALGTHGAWVTEYLAEIGRSARAATRKPLSGLGIAVWPSAARRLLILLARVDFREPGRLKGEMWGT